MVRQSVNDTGFTVYEVGLKFIDFIVDVQDATTAANL